MTDEELKDLLLDVDDCLTRALSDLSTAHTMALDADDAGLAQGIHESMSAIEAALGLTPTPRPTHRATEAVQ